MSNKLWIMQRVFFFFKAIQLVFLGLLIGTPRSPDYIDLLRRYRTGWERGSMTFDHQET